AGDGSCGREHRENGRRRAVGPFGALPARCGSRSLDAVTLRGRLAWYDDAPMAKLKLSYPEFRHAPAVVCGSGSLRSLADHVDESTVFLTSGSRPVLDLLGEALSRRDVSLTPANHVAKPDGEPTEAAIRLGAELLRGRPAGRIVAVGGGSVLDWARLACAHAAGVLDLSTGVVDQALAAQSRPHLCLVPTTCGTGAEAAD